MEYKEGRLGYNRKNDRYGLLVTDLWEIDGFSCGNRLQVEINGEWVDTHMEMDWSTGKGIWYLTGTDRQLLLTRSQELGGTGSVII